MANHLTMADIQAILTLHQRGWRNRRIARELNVDRETVTKYIRASACVPKPAKAPTGSAMMTEEAAEGPESPLSALASHEERGIEASASLPSLRRRRPRIQNQPKHHRLRAKTSQCASRVEAVSTPSIRRRHPLKRQGPAASAAGLFPWRRSVVGVPVNLFVR